MADEPRRSGRATKGQHKNASSSPAPSSKPTKSAKSKPPKKSLEPQAATSQEPEAEEEYNDEDEVIRCICGNNNPKDKRAFIGCDNCDVWQHNVCMGVPEDEDEGIPDSYLCEECGPDDHRETLQAMARGERIWDVRNKIYNNEKKAGRNRKSKGGAAAGGGWLKKDVPPLEDEGAKEEEAEAEPEPVEAPVQETGSKRKRGEEVKEEPQPAQVAVKAEHSIEEKPTRSSTRQDKRRKPAPEPQPDLETALVDIDKLPSDRQKVAVALSKILVGDIKARAKSGAYRIPDGQTPQSLGDHHAVRIEYALTMNHEGPSNPAYTAQFRTLFSNLKQNKLLIERLLSGSLTADELSVMDSKDLASEELQKERAVMKEALDRQAVAVPQQEGPRYRRTHKGDELIEDVDQPTGDDVSVRAAPVRERTSTTDVDMPDAGSPTAIDGAESPTLKTEAPLRVDTKRRESTSGGHERRQSSQQFDMSSIWAKTAQSPTSASAGPRPMQMPPRRQSSIPQNQQQDGGTGTKDDADIDRMLQDDEEDETYSPADYTDPDGVVWRGKIVQSADTTVNPTVNARFVAGRDISNTIAWKDLLPSTLSIDGRLAIPKAEEYLCSLQWSSSSDVSVLALSPYDDAEGFEAVFNYFKSRQRYAVVNKDKPALVRDLYIIPVDRGEAVPEHVGLLEYCRLKSKVDEKVLLATCVVSRAPDTPQVATQQNAVAAAEGVMQGEQQQLTGNMNGQHSLPQHMRPGAQGPAGSPLNTSSSVFSPTNNGQQQPVAGYGASGFPPNPYTPTPVPQQVPHANPLVNEILGPLQYELSAVQIIAADPNIAREKLEHLRNILVADPATRTDINALAAKLMGQG